MELLDLFEDQESLPAHIKQIINRFNSREPEYASCEQLVNELEREGYTCEYGLDAVPFNLAKIIVPKQVKIGNENPML